MRRLTFVPWSHFAASAASAFAFSAAFLLLAWSSFRARPAAAFELAGEGARADARSGRVSIVWLTVLVPWRAGNTYSSVAW